MARKTYRRHRKGGKASYVSETQAGNPNLPYSAPLQMMQGGRRHTRRNGKRTMRGGNASYPYSSASSYSNYVNGSEASQYDRVFSQAGPYAGVTGNVSIGVQGQNASMPGTPNANNLALIQNAGSRRRRGRRNTKKRRGGFLGQVLNQAIVPFGILGLQQSYKRNKSRSSKFRGSRRRYK
jgi:hypothetical protein